MRLGFVFVGVHFLILLSFPAIADGTPESKKVALLLELHEQNDPAFPTAEQEFQKFKAEINNNFPQRQVRRIKARSSAELKKQLDSVLSKEEKISHLFISAHGSSDATDKFNDFSLWIGKSDRVQVTHEIGEECSKQTPVSLQNIEAVRVFEGIRGKFTSDSRVMANSCEIFEGSKRVAETKATAFQYVIGQTDGSLYGNRVRGVAKNCGEAHLDQRADEIKAQLRLGTGSLFGIVAAGVAHYSPPRFRAAPLLAGLLGGVLGTSAGNISAVQDAVGPYLDPYNKGYRVQTEGSKIVSVRPEKYVFYKSHFFKPINEQTQSEDSGTRFSISAGSASNNAIHLTDVLDPFNY